ncbi:MAG: endonuclease domain-containing protein [Novosphingobium sp.]
MDRKHPNHDYAKARKLRAAMSLPEVLLWNYLRRKPMGVKFRRQHPVGSYVIDFYCPSTRIGIEIDGIAHAMGNRPAMDQARDNWLAGQGIRIVRIPASEVLKSVVDAAAAIVVLCSEAE